MRFEQLRRDDGEVNEKEVKAPPEPQLKAVERAANLIKEIRAKYKVNQDEIAQTIGVSQATIDNYEKGKIKKPSYASFLSSRLLLNLPAMNPATEL